MALESLEGEKYTDSLNSNNPDGGDSITFGDNHFRGVKNVVKNTLTDVDFCIGGYYVPSGTANAITITTTASITVLVTGMEFFIDVSTANAASATLDVNGIAAKAIVHPDGTALGGGELDGIIHVRYNGTAFELLSASLHAFDIQGNTTTYAADTGAADAYVATYSPVPPAYAAGQSFKVKIANSNTGASTFNVNSLGAKNIKLQDGTNPAADDLVAGAIIELTYDGTNFIITSALGNTATYVGSDKNVKASATDTTSDYLSAKIPQMPIGNAGSNEVLNIAGKLFFMGSF